MTVGEFRRRLADFPEDMRVLWHDEDAWALDDAEVSEAWVGIGDADVLSYAKEGDVGAFLALVVSA